MEGEAVLEGGRVGLEGDGKTVDGLVTQSLGDGPLEGTGLVVDTSCRNRLIC